MKERLIRVGKLLFYPAFYLFALALFGYLTFPFDRLKDRVIAEFDAAQRKSAAPGQAPIRLEIDKLGSYWFTGAEVKGVRIVIPPSKDPASRDPFGGANSDKPAPDTVLAIDEAHVRVRVLPLLIGRVRVDFWASVFGGEVKGSVPVGHAGSMEMSLEGVELAKCDPVVKGLGLPVRGTLSGELELSPNEGKFNKASGSLDLKVADLGVGDGKTKIQGLLAIPEAKLGDLVIQGEAKDGVLKITKFASSTGKDVDLAGDGKIAVREPASESTADLYVRFKFADGYRGKNDTTKALLGAPGSSAPGMLDLDPKVKRAKRADGFYGWHVYGPLSKLKFDPYSQDAPGAAASGPSAKPRKGIDGSSATPPKGNSVALPVGPSQANRAEPPSPPPPPPSPPPPPVDDPGLRVPPPPPSPPPSPPAGVALPPGMPIVDHSGTGNQPSTGQQPTGGDSPPPAPEQPAEGTAPQGADPTTGE